MACACFRRAQPRSTSPAWAAIYAQLARCQVAAQELAWGLKFSATATLDIEELPNGINAALRDG